MSVREAVAEQYDSLTPLVRPGDWDYATDELTDDASFVDGVIEEEVAHFYPRRNSHVRGHGWTFYRGTDEADYYGYIVCHNLPSSWDAWGCGIHDFNRILRSFRNNPFMLRGRWG